MDNFSTASLITRSTNDIQQVQMVFTMLFRIVLYAPILGIGGVLKVLNTDASMTWILGIAVAAILILVAVLFWVAMPKFKKLQDLIDRLNLVSREILTGIPVIRAFSREDQPVCQPYNDVYDASDDADHERNQCTDHLHRCTQYRCR